MKKTVLIIGLIGTIFLSGCGYKEGVVSATQKSYLYFTGNTNDTVVSIDSGEKFNIKTGANNQYAVKPGKHLVEVYKDSILVIKREIFISDGISKEIEVK